MLGSLITFTPGNGVAVRLTPEAALKAKELLKLIDLGDYTGDAAWREEMEEIKFQLLTAFGAAQS